MAGFNPVRRRRRFYGKVPTKTRLLRMICMEVGSNELTAKPETIRKALTEIINDDKMWELLKNFGGEVKKLAKYGIEQGY